MPAHLIEPTDAIECTFVPIMIFGPPGCGKTSLAQTAAEPLTLDFDQGIHRAKNRKRAMRFDAWTDCVQAGSEGAFNSCKTLIIDTGGRALDSMIPAILGESAKNGYAGNLTPQGWGVLGNRFTTWMKTVRSWGKDVVMVCHEEISKDANGNPDVSPDMPGKMSLKEMHKIFDLIGRVRYEGRKRVLDFNPCEGAAICKNAAGWQALEIPDLHANPAFLADMIADAKARIGQVAAASAKVAQEVDEWQAWLDQVVIEDIQKLNEKLPTLSQLDPAAKKQAWALIQKHAKSRKWDFDKKKNLFVAKDAA